MTSATNDALREKIARKIEANPSIKTSMLAETLGVPELDVLRAMPDGRAQELGLARLEELVRSIETLGTIYLVCRSEACVAEIKGAFGGFSRSGPFLNVSGRNVHLHLRLDRIVAAFAVRTAAGPSAPPMSSFQFFQGDGSSAFKVFLMESMQTEASDDFTAASARFEETAAAHA